MADSIRSAARGSPAEIDQAVDQFIASASNIQLADSQSAVLKMIKPDPKNLKTAAVRIKKEIQGMKLISHPNLLKVLDSDEEELWHVTEYHALGTLDNLQLEFKGNPVAALKAIQPLVRGVALIHDAEMVHRDIKAANVFVTQEKKLVLGDFGLVFFEDEKHNRPTETLENVGSWQWMPPWHAPARIEDVRPQFDVFSLGKLLWWMVSGLPINRLHLWYFTRPQLNVEKLFPNAPYIELINPLLSKCVVEEEKNCLQYASFLLREVNRCLEIISKNADQLSDTTRRPCRVCGLGKYNAITDGNVTSNLGLSNAAGLWFRAYSCDQCGHVETFSFKRDRDGRDVLPPAWSN